MAGVSGIIIEHYIIYTTATVVGWMETYITIGVNVRDLLTMRIFDRRGMHDKIYVGIMGKL